MSLPYAVRFAARNILNEKWINLLSILTIASGLFFSAVTVLLVYNLDILTKKLPEKFSVMIYLNNNLSEKEIENIIKTAGRQSAVDKVIYIPKENALKELKATLKNTEYVLDGLGENPLPDSIEVKLKPQAVTPSSVKQLTTGLREISGVDDIEYGEKFLSSIYSMKTGMNTIGFIFVGIMFTGMLFVCYSTVKILFYRREKEVETYKLLGATRGFIRLPFIIEGAAIGLCGGILSFVGMASLYYMLIFKVGIEIPLFKAIVFPVELVLVLPLTGLFIGITGSLLAIGRVQY